MIHGSSFWVRRTEKNYILPVSILWENQVYVLIKMYSLINIQQFKQQLENDYKLQFIIESCNN